MAKFHVEWKTGKKLTVEKSDCETVDQFINAYFGRNADVKEFGAKVTLVKPKAAEPVTVVKVTPEK